ncbi:MAG: GNAT family N-acetyltransferase [Chloroflexi bacterium]|nr:GNAT family N-acetyltransferase [Chloroflexota bacterium]
MVTIERWTDRQMAATLPDFIELLRDGVDKGASIGFLPPLSDDLAYDYWTGVQADVVAGKRILMVALFEGKMIGSAQLELAMRQNSRHRAEVQKVLVHSDYRRRGIGQQLMAGLEDQAHLAGRTLLVLDTRQGDSGEPLYRKMGYIEAGVIPRYAEVENGEFCATVFYYKLLI